jgi:hypothetical protein
MGPLTSRSFGAAALTLAAVVLGTSPAGAASGWSPPRVVYDGDFYDASMALDSAGHAHIVARGDTGIWYLTNESGSWARKRLTRDHEDRDGHPVRAYQPHLAVHDVADQNGPVVDVAYGVVTDLGGDPCCAPVATRRRLASSWSKPSTIPMRSSYPVAIAYGNGALVFVTQPWAPPSGEPTDEIAVAVHHRGGGWTTGTIEVRDPAVGTRGPSVAVDSTGHILVAYLRSINDYRTTAVWLARASDTHLATLQFTRERVTAAATDANSGRPSVALTEAGAPRIAFSAGGWTRFAALRPSGWHIEKVMRGDFASLLALDAHGHPRIATEDAQGQHRLWYAARMHRAWTATLLDKRVGLRNIAGIGVLNGVVSVGYGLDGGGPPRVWFTHTR